MVKGVDTQFGGHLLGEFGTNEELSLKNIRRSFGWTQEDLADALKVSVSSLSKWERGRTKQPLIASATRVTNRRLRYLQAMIPEETKDYVNSSPREKGLLHGEDLFVVCVSEGLAKHSPIIRSLIGMSCLPFLKADVKQQLLQNRLEVQEAFRRPGSIATLHSSRDRGKKTLLPDARSTQLQVLGHHLAIMDTEPVHHIQTPGLSIQLA